MGKIVFTRPIAEQHINEIREIAVGWEFVYETNMELLPQLLQESEVIIGWNGKFTEHIMKRDIPLRWIQNWSAGVDKLPLSELASRGIYLTNTSGIHAYPISETIFALILSFARRIQPAIKDQLNKHWGGKGTSTEIHGKTIGILGVGAIGSETARIAKGFGMTVIGVNSSGRPVDGVDLMYPIGQMEELLAVSDYVVNALPMTTNTRHIIGKAQFAAMKPTAYYINIGRGGTTDEAALYEALTTGVIGAAGLDVFETEPLQTSSPLWELDNVIITPHSAGSTAQSVARAVEIVKTNLTAFIRDGAPIYNVVDLERQY